MGFLDQFNTTGNNLAAPINTARNNLNQAGNVLDLDQAQRGWTQDAYMRELEKEKLKLQTEQQNPNFLDYWSAFMGKGGGK